MLKNDVLNLIVHYRVKNTQALSHQMKKPPYLQELFLHSINRCDRAKVKVFSSLPVSLYAASQTDPQPSTRQTLDSIYFKMPVGMYS